MTHYNKKYFKLSHSVNSMLANRRHRDGHTLRTELLRRNLVMDYRPLSTVLCYIYYATKSRKNRSEKEEGITKVKKITQNCENEMECNSRYVFDQITTL